MKRNILYLLIIGIGILFLNSCKKNNNTTSPSFKGMTYELDGAQTTETSTEGLMISGFNQFQIAGTDGTNGVFVYITNPAIGTFTVGKDNILIYYQSSPSISNLFTAISGQVTITTLTNDNAQGTFQFTATNQSSSPIVTKTVTEGKFNCDVIQR